MEDSEPTMTVDEALRLADVIADPDDSGVETFMEWGIDVIEVLAGRVRELEREKASILAAVREHFATEHDLAAECVAMGGHAATDTILRAQTARKALLAMVTP